MLQEKKNVNRKVSNAQIIEAHFKHLQGMSIVDLAKEVGLTRQNLRKRFIGLQLPYHRLFSKSTTLHRFFDNIDSEIKGYLLGFLAGDGTISDRSRQRFVAVGVQARDRCIVDWIVTHISPNLKPIELQPPLPNRQPVVKVQISSRQLVEDLQKHGLIERKSSNEFILQHIPIEVRRHVFRGFVDADGCVHVNKTGRIIVNAVCTSEPLLQQFQNWLKDAGIHSTITKCSKGLKFGNRTLFRIGIWSKKDVNLIEQYMYDKSEFYLERKRLKFLDNTELINRIISVNSVTTTD